MPQHLTLSLLLRGLTSDDAETKCAAVALVRSREEAEQTATAILEHDPKAREQFRGSARALAGFLRGRAGLMSAAARQANAQYR